MKSRLHRAAVLAIGSELLTPTRVDTNSLFITEQLNVLGIDVVFKGVVGDDRTELAQALRFARERAELIVCSGGLGPTDDDVTREAVAEVLGTPLREDESITAALRARYAARFSGAMPEINRRQAMVPHGAQVLDNSHGSAPGLWIEDGDRVVLLVPGPPRELRPMLTALAAGVLRERASGVALLRRVLKIAGRIESQTEEALLPLYARWREWPVRVEATILAALGQIELHLTTRAAGADRSADALERAAADVLAVLGEDVFSSDGRSLEEVVGGLLVHHGLRIGIAESCTGGLITSRLTDVPGSSRYVERSIVSYSNEAKTELLDVPGELIQAQGAVSEPVALAMARGVLAHAPVEIGVGVTGVAGPGGGTQAKPVGLVAIAAVRADEARSRVFRFIGERGAVKYQASQAALDMVRRMLL